MKAVIANYIKLKRSKSTKEIASLCLKKFFEWKYATKCKSVDDAELLAEKYLIEYQFEDILDYIIWLRDIKKYQPHSVASYSGFVVNFLEYYDINFSKSQYTKIQNTMPRVVTVTRDKPFTKEIVQSMCAHSDTMMKAIILLATSSGMRINEVLNLEIQDIEYGNPNKIYLSREKMKQGKPHTYRFSSEASAALKEWLKIRDEYERDGIRRSEQNLKQTKKKNPALVFPIKEGPFYARWYDMLAKAGYDERDKETNRYLYSSHGCRRWFSSTASKHTAHEIAEAMIGHDTGLSSSYRRYPEEELDKEYLKIESFLLIYAPSDYSEMKGDMAKALQEQMITTAQLATSLLTLNEKIEAMEVYIKATKSKL